MKIMIDLNVFLDVFQERQQHYEFSSVILTMVLNKQITGFIAGHSVTTLFYLVTRFSGKEKALETIDWVLSHFEVESADKRGFKKARKFHMKDYEDAVVAGCAKNTDCDYIVTRNIKDFKESPIPAIAPENFLKKYKLFH